MYKVSMVAKQQIITIIIMLGLLGIWTERFFAFIRNRGNRKSNKISLIVVTLASVLVILFLVVLPSMNNIKIKDQHLSVMFSTAFTSIELSGAEIKDAKIIDWSEDTDLEPIVRTMGSSIGSYKEGSFTLRNGQKALVYTNSSRVLCLTLDDRLVLLGPDDFAAFIADFEQNIRKLD